MKKTKNTTNLFIRECITQALIKLMKTKPLSSITITELTKSAGVSRMSYYRNFNSKEEIFSSYLETIFSEYEEYSKYTISGGVYYDTEHLTHYLTFILKYKDFLYALTDNGYSSLFLMAITEYMLNNWHINKSNNVEYYTLIVFAGGLYNIYISWAKNDFKEEPEEIVNALSNIHYHKILE